MGTLSPLNTHARRGRKGVAGHWPHCCKRSGSRPHLMAPWVINTHFSFLPTLSQWVPFPLTMRMRAEDRKGLRDTSSTVASAVEQAPPHGPLGHQHTLILFPTTTRVPTGPVEGLGHCSRFEPTSHPAPRRARKEYSRSPQA